MFFHKFIENIDMFFNLLLKFTKLVLFVVFVSFSTKAQTKFSQDSLQIIKNSDELLQQPAVKSKDSVAYLLNNELQDSNAATDDLIQFYMARYFYLKQQIPIASEIVRENIEDQYNENYSDAKFYNIQGAIFSLKKEYEKAISSFLESANLYKKEGNSIREYTIYNNVANIYLALGDHRRAYEYSSNCFDEFRSHPENPNYLSFIGVLAVCETNLKMLDSAMVHIEHGLSLLENSSDIIGGILINYAKAELEFEKENYHQGIPFARKSLKQSEMYSLKDYEIISSIILMKIHNKLMEYELALNYGEIALENSNQSSNLSLKHSISDGIATAHAGIGNYHEAFIFKSQSDSLKTIDRDDQTKRSIDSLLVQFESLDNRNKILGQEVIIANQNHTLERRNSTLIIISFTLLMLVFLIIVLFLFNKQRLRLIKNKQEVELINAVSTSEEEERTRLSSLLHDGLAAELTALKLELEQHSGVSEKSFEMLATAHSLTRRVSHNLSPYMIDEKGLVDAVAYLVSNNNVNKNLYFNSNITGKLNIASKVETILFRSTQELLQNAINHAEASEIVVQVMLNGNYLTVSVEDDGIGMDISKVNDSIGLGSLKKRIEVINGELNIDSSPANGTSAFIKLKLEK